MKAVHLNKIDKIALYAKGRARECFMRSTIGLNGDFAGKTRA